jgi:hypothetical protein
MYEEFLEYLSAQSDGWHALPREVAQWWQTRERLSCVQARVEGPGAERASVAWARTDDGGAVAFDIEPAGDRAKAA